MIINCLNHLSQTQNETRNKIIMREINAAVLVTKTNQNRCLQQRNISKYMLVWELMMYLQLAKPTK